MSSANKIAVVTGAGSGIGRASAIALSRAGFTLALAGRRLEALQGTASEIADGNTLIVPTDVGDPDRVKALFAQIKGTFGRLDLLFNNAGVGVPPVPFDEITFAQWQSAVTTNLTGPFLCAQEAFRLMKSQTPRGGRIINNGSISAHVPRPLSAPYTATKHAITGLTRSLALDGRAYDIACGQIDIGNALSEMTSVMAAGVLQPDGSKKPEARMAVENVANAIVHMAMLPPEANVLFMTVMATKMPFVGRG